MTKPPELLPCPFCRDEAVKDRINWSGPECWMYCAKCHAKGPRVMMQRNEESEDWLNRAIAAWNTRTPDPAVQALVDAAREVLLEVTPGHEWEIVALSNLRAALAAFDKT